MIPQQRIVENQQQLLNNLNFQKENNNSATEINNKIIYNEPPKIHVSTNYKLFVPHDLQRKLQDKNLKRLRESTLRHNLMHEYPIHVIQEHTIVDEDHPYKVVDGNHRRVICQELQIPIYFMICNDFRNNDIIDTGYCLSKWSIPQFCEFYCKLGKESYIKFKKFVDDFNLDILTALPITKLPKNRTGLSDSFRIGNFTFDDEQEVRHRVYLAIEFLDKLISFGLAKKELRDNSNFFDGFFKLMNHPQYDQKRMIERFTNKRVHLTHVPTFSRHMQFYECFKCHFLGVKEE